MGNAFSATRKLFIEHTGYTHPLSYEEWKNIPGDHKAAVLFVQFYNEITLAWFKTKSFFVLEEDGVECMLQYLCKNVPIIEQDESKFTPNYIYRVAYNCLYCISHDIKRDIDRYHTEVSNVVQTNDGEEVNLYDTAVSFESYEEMFAKQEFWSIIDDMGVSTIKVVNHILNGTPLKKSTVHPSTKKDCKLAKDPEALAKVLEGEKPQRQKDILARIRANEIKYNNHVIDKLKNVEVTVEEAEEIINKLKVALNDFKDEYYI